MEWEDEWAVKAGMDIGDNTEVMNGVSGVGSELKSGVRSELKSGVGSELMSGVGSELMSGVEWGVN